MALAASVLMDLCFLSVKESLCATGAVILYRLWDLLILSISGQCLWVRALQAAALCSPDGFSQQPGDRGQANEVPIFPIPLRPCHIVLQVYKFWSRHALAKVNHPDVGLTGAVVDEEEWAANHLEGCGSGTEDMRWTSSRIQVLPEPITLKTLMAHQVSPTPSLTLHCNSH